MILITVLVLILRTLYLIIKTAVLKFIPTDFKHVKNIGGKTVLITGAGSGLGRQLAVEFSKYSSCVVLLDIDKNSMLRTKKLIDRRSSVFLYECNVADKGQVYEVAERVKNDCGLVDILVNNAGIAVGKTFLDTPDEMIEKIIGVNALANFWTCKAFLPGMMEKNAGHIVFIASVAAFCGCPKVTAYCSSKFATVGFAESLEMELRKDKFDGIKVTTICPSVITTGMFEGAKLSFFKPMTPEEAAKEILNAVLEERELVIYPEYVAFLLPWKLILPTPAKNEIMDALQIINSMDNFVGRTTDDNSVRLLNQSKTTNNTD